MLAAVRREGDAAVRRYVAKFEGFKGRDLRVAFDLKALEASIDKGVAAAVRDAMRCGVKVIASVHARDEAEAAARLKGMDMGVFERVLVLGGGVGQVRRITHVGRGFPG